MIPIYKDNNGQDVRLAHTYNGLTLNNPADPTTDTYEINRITPRTDIQSIIEPHQGREGSEAWGARKTGRLFRVDGVIRAPTLAKLHDKIKALAEAFDPDKATLENPDAQGFLPYDFSVPTTDTATYASGLVPSRYLVRAIHLPEPTIDYGHGYSAAYTIDLFARDPRRYLQTAETFGAASGDADNTAADYRSFPSVTITMSGAGNVAATLTNSTVGNALVLDLSDLVDNDVVVVDMEQKFITLNGTGTMSLYVSGDYWWMSPGEENALALTNSEGIESWLVSWRPAFCL